MSGKINISSDWTITGDGTNNVWKVSNNQTNADYLTISEGGPVSIKNANLRLHNGGSANRFEIEDGGGARHIFGDDTRTNLYVPAAGGSVGVRDDVNAQDLMRWHEGGPVEVLNTDLKLPDNGAQSVIVGNVKANSGGYLTLSSGGDGTDLVRIYDTANSQDLLVANEGGPVQLPNVVTEFSGGGKGIGQTTVTARMEGFDGANSHAIEFVDTNSNSAYAFSNSGELEAEDSAGNVTTLT